MIQEGDSCLKEQITSIEIARYSPEGFTNTCDHSAIEEPLEVFLDDKPFYLTMRLPGDETMLSLGYCFSEGIIDTLNDVLSVDFCEQEEGNKVNITLNPERKNPAKERRHISYSSCGICGKEMLDDICRRYSKIEYTVKISQADIVKMMNAVEKAQSVFPGTGGTHAAGIFDSSHNLIAFAEDIGRHNALDKCLGWLIYKGKMRKAAIIVITSRLSFEIVQKAGRSGAQILIGISSATTLAIDLAKKIGLTLIGFARNGSGDVYSGVERICI
jgi:FdhD protein